MDGKIPNWEAARTYFRTTDEEAARMLGTVMDPAVPAKA
jgi:hypothetical protein